MNNQQYFLTTSLSYQLKAARQELADFRSGEVYQKLRADYEGIIRDLNLTIKKLCKERDEFSFSRKKSQNSGPMSLKICRKNTKKKLRN